MSETGIEKIRELHYVLDSIAYYFKEPGMSEGQTRPVLKSVCDLSLHDLEYLQGLVVQAHDLILDLDSEKKN